MNPIRFLSAVVLVIVFSGFSTGETRASAPTPSTGPTQVAFRADQTLLVNGAPYLPFGFYIDDNVPDPERMAALETIAAAGFNTVYLDLPLPEQITFLDRAAQLGVKVLVADYEGDLAIVKRYQNHPAVLGWVIADDANDGTDSASTIQGWHASVKAADPNHITYIAIFNGDTVPQFFNASDVVGWETYPFVQPLPAGEGELTTTEVELAHAAIWRQPFNRPVWALPQTFPWPDGRTPTAALNRAQTYIALVDGSKGVVNYSFAYAASAGWSRWNLGEHAELWDGVKALVPEMKTLEPVILNGARTKVTTGNPQVTAAYWKYQGKVYVVVVNTSELNAKNVSIPLPRGVSGLQSLFANRPAGLTLKDDSLMGTIQPTIVQVYQLDYCSGCKVLLPLIAR